VGGWEVILELSTMDVLFKDGLGVDLLKLGLEIVKACLVAATVGTTTFVGHSETGICHFLAFYAPDIS
jgi:hypothetical protein